MGLVEAFDSPLAVLSALPWMLLLAWVARRLLGARRLTLRTSLLAGLGGYVAGLAMAWALTGGPDAAGDTSFVLTAVLFAVGFMMVAMVGLELAADRHSPAPSLNRPSSPRVPRPLRAVRRHAANTRRLAEVSRIAARHGLAGLLGLGRSAPAAGVAPNAVAVTPNAVAVRARRALEDAGGMFVKLGQLLSTRVDLIPLDAAREFARLQERAAPSDAGAVRRVLEEELGRPVDEVFAEFDWEPLAAASLGQVYAAKLRSGEAVAVKVQRPGISAVVDRDLAIVRRLARIAEARTDWGRAYGVAGIAEEFATRLLEELDYRVEARNAAEVDTALKHLPEIHVHTIWEDLSTSRLLVMERLDGVSVGKLDPAAADDAARGRLADALVRAELEPMLAGERFHADPHPGNVFLLSDCRLGLLDFGACGRLDAFERSSVTAMLGAIREGDPTLLREAVVEVAAVDGRIDVYRLDRALARFMARHLRPGATPDAEALSELLGVFGAHGIALPSTTTTMFRALVTLEGTLNALVPGYRVVEAAEQVGRQLLDEQLTPASLRDRSRDEMLKLAPLLQRAPRHLDRIATLVESGDLRTRVSLLSEPGDVRIVSRLVNRGVLAFVGSTIGVVSAILLGIDGGPAVTPAVGLLDLLGYAGLAAGAVLLLRVILAAVLEDESGPGS